jgi:hypothetical protein
MNGIESGLTQSDSWKNLKQHFLQIKKTPLAELFLNDPLRVKKFSLKKSYS